MPVQLKNIPGALVQEKRGIGDSGDHPFEFGQTIGFNQAITQQGQVKIGINRENLANIIGILFGGIFYQDRYVMSDAIIAKQKDLFEVVK